MLRTDIAKPHDLMARLRARTGEAHRRLERDLDLLRQPLSMDRYIYLLERFYGFHAVWETQVGRTLKDEAAFLLPRRRIHRIEQDLRALGVSERAIAELPLCLAAARLVQSPEAAIGSLYVMEGSTLGGQIITRNLATARWLPAEGLGYFDPYGVATGTMWRHFAAWAEVTSARVSVPAIVAGALATFETLHGWLTPVRW